MPDDRTLFVTRRPWLIYLGLALLLAGSLLPRLGEDVALSSHESYVAVTARNMLENRGVVLPDGRRPSPYLIPNFNDEPRLRKPPLPYWIVAGLGRLTGEVNEWTARLPAVLAAIATALTLAWLVRQQGGRSEGWLAGLTVATMVGFLLLARRAMADMPLAFFTTACCAAMWTACGRQGRKRFAWLTVAGATGGLAVLTKGPAAILFLPGPALVVAGVIAQNLWRRPQADPQRRADVAWTFRGMLAATLLFLAISLAWPIYVSARVPEAASIWKAESIGRAVGDLGREEPVYFYLLRLPVLVLPWTYFFLHGIGLAIRRVANNTGDRAWLLFVGAWLLVPLLGFSAAAGKQDHYLLPALPAAAIYATMAMKHLFSPGSPAAARAARRVGLIHGGAFVAAGVATAVYVIHIHAAHQVGGVLLGGLIAAVGILATLLAARGRFYSGQVALAVAILVALPVAWSTLVGPVDKATEAERFGRDVARLVPPDAPLFFFAEDNATVIFYADRPIPLLTDSETLAAAILAESDMFVIGRSSPLPQVTPPRRWNLLAFEGDTAKSVKGLWLFRGTAASDGDLAQQPTPEPAKERSTLP